MRVLRDKRLKGFLKDQNRKGVLKMVKELFILTVNKKEIPFYYFLYPYKKNVENYKDYLSTREKKMLGMGRLLHKREYNSLLDNKLCFALFFKKTAIKIPKLLSYNLEHNFFFKNDVTTVNSKDELKTFFKMVFKKSNINELFFRPPEEFGGKGCFKLTRENFDEKLSSEYENLIKGMFVQTKVLKQHQEINKIHKNSLNTLRIVTLATSKGITEIVSVFMRFGVGNSVVDNASSGGFFVGMDLEKGILNDKGLTLPEYGGEEVYAHPDNGFKFGGFKIPYYEEACKLVKEAVKVVPDRLIGWDVAITPKGPVITESNCVPDLSMSDSAYGGILRNKHIREVIDELNLVK